MLSQGWFVDAMLLVLLVVGKTNRMMIQRHRRLDAYSAEDFDTLVELIDDSGGVVWVTPNTLTEASNLLAQHGSPEREQLTAALANLISDSREVLVHSGQASSNVHFLELGLTDSAILEVISTERPLLTGDGRLYAAALATDSSYATNFNHHRASELGA